MIKKSDEISKMQSDDKDAMIDAVDKRIAEMLKAAEKKAEAIIEAAMTKVNGIKEKEPDADAAKANAELEEYVEIKLFKDNGKYKDDVYVSVNGENCVIKRGIKTKIKKKFALVLEQSDMQDYLTSQLMETKAAEYEASAREHGM